MTGARGHEAGRTGQVADVVAAHVGPLTRFGAADLKPIGAETESWAEVGVTTRQRVELDWVITAHAGHLSPEVPTLPDQAGLEAALQQRLASAESAAAQKIQHWATDGDDGSYRRLLPRGLFIAGLDEQLGVDATCGRCQARGRHACPACRGQGGLPCPDCHGKGRCTCAACRGMGRVSCPGCHGQGQVDEAFTEMRPDPASGRIVETRATRRVPCTACRDGWHACDTCQGSGESACPTCQATGSLTCTTCQGQRDIACEDCGATGWRHLIGQLREHIEIEDIVDLQHADPAVAATAAARYADVVTLGEVCTLDAVRYTVAPFAVQAQHRLRLPVRQATLQVAGQTLDFTAFGPQRQVFDLRHVASALLTQDLVTLEKNAYGSGRHLRDALERFMTSPLNATLAERIDTAALLQRHPGLLDADYVERATRAMQHAVERLWSQHIGRPSLACIAVAGGVGALMIALGSPLVGLAAAVPAGALAGTAGWVATDWLARRRLARSFGQPLGERLLRPLRRATAYRRTALAVLLGSAAVAAVAAMAATRLPHVQQRLERAHHLTAFTTRLDTWWRDGKDYRLRDYPATAPLQEAAARGDARARVILAWKLLLGLGLASPDARQAARLLDDLPAADEPVTTAAAIGRARTTLAGVNRSTATLQAAVSTLEALDEPVPAEALYTLALLQLAPPLSGRANHLDSGLAALQQAADAGHPSACLDLGRRLANGQGLRRDPQAARRYLNFAIEKDVPGATQALAALKP